MVNSMTRIEKYLPRPQVEIADKEIDLSDLVARENAGEYDAPVQKVTTQRVKKTRAITPEDKNLVKLIEVKSFEMIEDKDLEKVVRMMYAGDAAEFLQMSKQHVHTPFALCWEILENMGVAPNKKFLVVTAVEFVVVLLDVFKVSKENIFFLDEGQKDGTMDSIKAVVLEELGLEQQQILTFTEITKMKFDYIVGNPPYQSEESETKKLWQEFIKHLINNVQFGKLGFVTPNAWFYEPDGRKIKQTTKAMMTGNVLFADTSRRISEEFFPGIGEDIGYWIWSKDKAPGTVIHRTGTIDDYQVSMTRPQISIADVMRQSIQSKLESKLNEGYHSIRVEGLKGMQWQAGPQSVGIQQTFSLECTEQFSQSVRITPAQTMYCEPERVNLNRGVCITNSGYYFKSKNPEKYMPDTDEPTAQNFLKILVSGDEESKAVYSYIKSRLYIIFTMKIIGKAFNDYALARLPFLGKDKVWTDSELYEFFNLTQEEIEYVESFEMP